MTKFYIRLQKYALQEGEQFQPHAGHHAIWLQSGEADISGQVIQAGDGAYVSGASVVARKKTVFLHFLITASAVSENDDGLLNSEFEWPEGDALFRLDQVSFPPCAQAYRHVHPGAGIRVLIAGQLQVQSDHHTETMTPGSTWFEDANSPVKVTAGPEPTAFIRAMVLPPEFIGQPTLTILNPEDQNKPRLQSNRRFFDQCLILCAN